MKFVFKIWDLADRILPWTIGIPFYFFTFGTDHFHGKYTCCVEAIKNGIKEDLKSGLMKAIFLKSWLKENTLNRVIFNNNDFNIWGKDLFVDVIRSQSIQKQISLVILKTLNIDSHALKELQQSLISNKKRLLSKLWEPIKFRPRLKKEIFNQVLMYKIVHKFFINKEKNEFDFRAFLNALNN